jgi:hypothetical protein
MGEEIITYSSFIKIFIVFIQNILTNFSLKICRLLVEEGLPFARLALRVFSPLSLVIVKSQSQNYVTTDGQSASLSWNKAPIWGLRPDFHYCQTIAGLLIWGALSDEGTGLSFTMYNIQYIYILHAIT